MPASGPWHQVERSARPQRSEDVSPGSRPRYRDLRGAGRGPAVPGREPEACPRGLQRMTGPGAPRIPPSSSIAPSPGPRPRTSEEQAVLRPRVSRRSGRPQDPRASRLRASSQGDPRPLLARYSPISGSGREGNGYPPEPPGPRAAPGAWQRRPGPGEGSRCRPGAEEPRLPGRLPRTSQPGAQPRASQLLHLAQNPAPPRSPRPGRAHHSAAGSRRSVDPALDATAALLTRLCSTTPGCYAGWGQASVSDRPKSAPPPGPGSEAFVTASASVLTTAAGFCRIRWAGSPDCPAHPPVPDA